MIEKYYYKPASSLSFLCHVSVISLPEDIENIEDGIVMRYRGGGIWTEERHIPSVQHPQCGKKKRMQPQKFVVTNIKVCSYNFGTL